MIISEKLLSHIRDKILEKHRSCREDQFDNGYFWALKELEQLILDGEFDDNQ